MLSDKEFYEKLSKQTLSEKEVFEAKHNFVGFFDLLFRIDKRLKEQQEKGSNKTNNENNTKLC